MIYLIRSSAYKNREDKACTEFETILKIGYTKEDGIKSRTDAYLTENPTCQVIALIPDGDMQDESNLHWYFREYKKPYGNEWFEEVQEIYDFFQVNDTIEKIRSAIPTFVSKRLLSSRELNFQVRYWILAIQDVTGRDLRDVNILYHLSDDETIDLICEEFPYLAGCIVQTWEDFSEPREIIEYLRNTKNGTFKERLRFLCESEEFTEEEKKKIARLTSESFDKYYNILGPERCKACGYLTDRLNREIQNKLISKSVIREKFLDKFKVGSRYTRSDSKETIKAIYSELGLEKFPKASDLEEFFNLRTVKILNPLSKKKDNGFEIIGIK